MAAAIVGIACRADEALLAHPILGNDESRETIGGVRAILERALDEEEVEAAVEAATTLGFTRFKRMLGATLADMTRPANAANVEERGMGLTLGAARGLALELAVAQKTFDELEDGEDPGGAAPAEVVAPERELVAKLAPALALPDWSQGQDLPTKEALRLWGVQASSMAAGYSTHLGEDITKVMKDPETASGDLAEWKTSTDKVFGQKLVGSMAPEQLLMVDSAVVEEGYGLAILMDIAKTTLVMTSKTLEKAIKAYQDPTPCTKKGTLFRKLQQWTEQGRDLTKQGQVQSDLIVMSSLKKLVSGVTEAREIVKSAEMSGTLSDTAPTVSTLKSTLERESKKWYQESREGVVEKAKVAKIPAPDPKKWCFDWVMGGACPRGSVCPHTHDPKHLGKPSQAHLNHFKRPCMYYANGACSRMAAGTTCYFQHPEGSQEEEEPAAVPLGPPNPSINPITPLP